MAGISFAVLAEDSEDIADVSCWVLPAGPESLDCYVDQILNNSETANDLSEASLGLSQTLLDQPGYPGVHFANECHEVLHVVGRVQAEAGETEIEELPVESCLTGYFHGVLEYVLADVPDQQLFNAAQNACPEGKTAENLCEHLAGHLYTQRHLDANIETVINLCSPDPTITDARQQLAEVRCLDGAFMEQSLYQIRSQKWRGNPSLALAECRELDSWHALASEACYGQVGAKLLVALGSDPVASIIMCGDEQTTRQNQWNCVAGVANLWVAFEGPDPQVGVDLCVQFENDNVRLWCSAGIDLSRHTNQGDRASAEVCAAFFVDVQLDQCEELSRGRRNGTA